MHGRGETHDNNCDEQHKDAHDLPIYDQDPKERAVCEGRNMLQERDAA